MDGAARRGALAALLLLLLLAPGAAGSPTPPGAAAAAAPPDTCTSCGFRRPPDESGAVDGDFLQAVKRHILSRLQMRERPNITHAVPKAAMVTALRKLHAGKVRDDGRVEIPSLDGQASAGPPAHQQTSEIISFAETGGAPSPPLPAPALGQHLPPPLPTSDAVGAPLCPANPPQRSLLLGAAELLWPHRLPGQPRPMFSIGGPPSPVPISPQHIPAFAGSYSVFSTKLS